MGNLRRWFGRRLASVTQDEPFLEGLDWFESILSKVLSIAMVGVILVTVVDLFAFLARSLVATPDSFFLGETLTQIFGAFLSILIALEILENITAYLKKHVVQVELVIATSLTAVARKIIILDLSKITGVSLIGLAIAILALSISYWIVRQVHQGKS